MKKIPALLFLAALTATTLTAQVLDRPVAVVRLTDTVNVGRQQLDTQLALFQQQLGRALTDAEKQQILDALINDELLLQAASRAGVRVTQQEIQNYVAVQKQQFSQAMGAQLTDDQFRAQVQRQTGKQWSDFLTDVTNELIKLKFVRQQKADLFAQQGAVTDVEITKFYDENATSFSNPAMVSFRHVYLDLRGKSDAERQQAKATMDGFMRQIRNGTLTFEQLEHQAIDNPQISADNFGYLMRNDSRSVQLLGRDFIDKVFALDQGQVGGVFESNVALHIVMLTDKRAPRLLQLDDPLLPGQNVTVRQQIRSLLQNQKDQQTLAVAVQAVVTDLRKEAEITIFQENLPW